MTQGLDRQIERLEARFQSEPGGRIFASLADAYRRAGDLERARELVEGGLARHPTFVSGHVVAGCVHRDRGDEASAIAAFRRALELDPENVVALRNLAELDESAGRLAQALRWYGTLQALELRDPEIDERLAELRARVAEAVTEPEAREPEPEAAAELWREAAGEVALEVGRPEGEGAGAREPEAAAEPPEGVGFEPAEAREAAEEGVPAAQVLTQTMGELYAQQGFYDRAVAVYRVLVERDPENERLRRRLAELETALLGGGEAVEVEGVASEPEPEPVAEAGVAAEGAVAAAGEDLLAEEAELRGARGEEYDAFFADMVEVVVPDLEVVAEGPTEAAEEAAVPEQWEAAPEPAEAGAAEPAGALAGPEERGAAGRPGEREETIEVLAEQWAVGPGDTLELSTPFAWSEEAEAAPEAEEDEGPPIREYFQRLLAWMPQAVPIEELAPEAGAHEGGRTPSAEPPPAPVETPVSAEVVEEEPWLAAPLTAQEAVSEPVAPAGALADEPFPWELEAEPPAERGAEGPAAGPAAAAPGVGAEAETHEAEARPAEEEDDDLETFREWLKSLKR